MLRYIMIDFDMMYEHGINKSSPRDLSSYISRPTHSYPDLLVHRLMDGSPTSGIWPSSIF
jgi:hypothetical protein